MARQLAYLENTPLPGPDADPDGWHCLDSLPIRGSVFSTREVDARCTVRPHAATSRSPPPRPLLSRYLHVVLTRRHGPRHTVRARQTRTSVLPLARHHGRDRVTPR